MKKQLRTILLIIVAFIAILWLGLIPAFNKPEVLLDNQSGDQNLLVQLEAYGRIKDTEKSFELENDNRLIDYPLYYEFYLENQTARYGQMSDDIETSEDEVFQLFSVLNRPSFLKEYDSVLITDNFSLWRSSLTSAEQDYHYGFINHQTKEVTNERLPYDGDNALQYKQYAIHNNQLTVLWTLLNDESEDENYYKATFSIETGEILDDEILSVSKDSDYRLAVPNDLSHDPYNPFYLIFEHTKMNTDRSSSTDSGVENFLVDGENDYLIVMNPEDLTSYQLSFSEFDDLKETAKKNVFIIEDEVFTYTLEQDLFNVSDIRLSLYKVNLEEETFELEDRFNGSIQYLGLNRGYLFVVFESGGLSNQLQIYDPRKQEVAAEAEFKTNDNRYVISIIGNFVLSESE